MSTKNNDKSVTVVVTRKVTPGRETDYRKWFDDISRVASRFTGYLGATLEGPTSTNEFHSIFRYDNIEHLRDWERSQEREEWTAKLDGIVEGATRVDEYCGLEFLFDSKGPDIPKYRIVIVLTVVVFAMLLTLRPLVAAILTNIPASLQLFLAVTIQVTIMTYAVMPLIYRYLGGWLRK